ncbi:MAG: hypothetical protein U1E21_04460 [Reyranellaceae bacterium]
MTIGRALGNTFAGIAPANAPGFVVAQCVGLALALLTTRLLDGKPNKPA